jgi:Domain of unknown function (DUF5134)
MLAAAARAELAFCCYARKPSPEDGEVTGPGWLTVGLAALMLLIAACSAGRLTVGRVRGRVTEPDVDAVHVLMGVAMAGMFEPRLSPVPGAAWQLVFLAAAAWFAWRAIRARRQGGPGSPWCAHPAAHAVECAVMIYMLLPAGRGQGGTMPGMAGSAPAGNPALALVLALFMLGYILWITDRLAAMSRARAAAVDGGLPAGPPAAIPGPAGSGGVGVLTRAAVPARLSASVALAPRFAACSKIAMSIGMGYMLVTMI